LKSIVLAAALGSFAACSASDVTGPRNIESKAQRDSAALFGIFNPRLVTCPGGESATSTSELGPLGGVLSAGGVSVSVPAGALLEPVTMTLSVPASQYVEVDVSVEGVDHFLFETPVTVTMSYARCTRWDVLLFPNAVFHIDSDSKQLLERMPTFDNKLTRTVTFTTGHLSGYALAN